MGKKLEIRTVNKIQNLRARGLTIPEICSRLNLPKTTVYNYAKNVQILPESMEEWRAKRGGSRRIRLLKEEQAFVKAKKIVKQFSKREKLLFISALYWAEGNKKDFMLSNTDSNLIKVFINGLREIFGIGNDRLRVSIRIYEDMDKEKCLDFWANVVSLPKEKFQNVYILNGKKQGKLEFGMCRVRVAKGGDLLKQLSAINKSLANKVANY
jgi:hypothetical protein